MDNGYAFIECRDWGHGWRQPSKLLKNGATSREVRQRIEEYQVADWETSRTDALRSLVCLQCGSFRFEWFANSGVRLSHPRYQYVPGYLIKKDEGGPVTRSEFREIAVKAAIKTLRRR